MDLDKVLSPDTTEGYISIGRHHAIGNNYISSQVRFGAQTGGDGTSFLAFATGGGESLAERMRIANNGSSFIYCVLTYSINYVQISHKSLPILFLG
jgi:hypothetical protein